MPRLAVVGYANTGRTTLFNALTGIEAPAASYPFSTTETAVGVVHVPDEKLDLVAALEGSSKTGYTAFEVVDLPSHHGSAFSPEVTGRLHEMDGLIVVLRAFESVTAPSDESGIDPVSQAEALLVETALADNEALERRLERARKEAAADPTKRRTVEIVSKAAELVGAGTAMRSVDWSEDERKFFRDMGPLTLKPVVWLVNVAEGDETDYLSTVSTAVPGVDTVIGLSVELEEEASRLDAADRAEMLEALGLGEGALSAVVRAAYEALRLVTFYTVNPNEAHAWAVRRGTTARAAAGKVHSDLERGFIRAEVVGIDEMIETGGWAATKQAGRQRVEGQDYVVQDGDVLLVRFSV